MWRLVLVDRRLISVRSVAEKCGPAVSSSLLSLHAFTRCYDTYLHCNGLFLLNIYRLYLTLEQIISKLQDRVSEGHSQLLYNTCILYICSVIVTYDKFPDFFRMGTFIDSTHILLSIVSLSSCRHGSKLGIK